MHETDTLTTLRDWFMLIFYFRMFKQKSKFFFHYMNLPIPIIILYDGWYTKVEVREHVSVVI